MISDRSSRNSLSIEQATEEQYTNSGIPFDIEIVEKSIKYVHEIKNINGNHE